MKEFWPGIPDSPIVIWTCSNESFYNGYQKVIEDYPKVNFKYQNQWEFKILVVESVLPEKPYTVFFVDDLVFKNPFSMSSEEFKTFQKSEDILCLSLRLHPYLTYCYTMNIPMRMPQYLEGRLRIWEWKKEAADFGYPMSVDAHLYRTSDLIEIISKGNYVHPGEFENALLTAVPNRPKMICFEDSKIVNIPVNRVGPYPNRYGNIRQDYLNDEYLKGRRISLKTVKGFKNISCHQEIDLQWE
jgi:hypothetical protein